MKKDKLTHIILILGALLVISIITIMNYLKPVYYAFGDYDYKKGPNYSTKIKDYNKITYENGVKAKVFLKKKGNQKSVCFMNDNNLVCFKNNNYRYENKHVQKVFKSLNLGKCEVGKSMTICNNKDFYCYIETDGSVGCEDEANAKYCNIMKNGATSCGNYE